MESRFRPIPLAAGEFRRIAAGDAVRCPHCGGKLWDLPGHEDVFVRQAPTLREADRAPKRRAYHTMVHRKCHGSIEFYVASAQAVA